MNCTNQIYKGDYGFIGTGTLIGGAGAFAVVGRFTADGQGNITGSETRNSNGVVVVNETYTEKYTVNSDCTGTSVKTPSGTGIHKFAFVVLDRGKTIESIETSPGNVVTLRAERIG
jgi:hypothetical protein